MCIIAAKPAGIPMPDSDTIENMWYSNPNGAGIMYPVKQARKGKRARHVVRIEKGFMTLIEFQARLESLGKEIDLTETPVVMHFRITTHGGTKPENCHPFPVTESIGVLQKRKSSASLGVAHNGIIDCVTPRKDISDTMEYIATQLAPLYMALPRFWENKHAMRLVENAIDSKMAFLTPEGSIHTIGQFTEDKGILYSNTTYRPYYYNPRYSTSCYGGWGYTSLGTWGKGADETDLTPTMRSLYQLDNVKGSFVKDKLGEMFEPFDYAVDHNNAVYWFDCNLGYWIPSSMTAHAPGGAPFRYDSKGALAEEVLTAKQVKAWYDMLEEDCPY